MSKQRRARFSVLARLVHGRDIATSPRGAEFASGRAALESFRAGKVWHRLGAAIGARVTSRDKRLLAARARAVRAAMLAIHAQRASASRAGKVETGAPVARSVILTSGTASVQFATRRLHHLANLPGVTLYTPGGALGAIGRLVKVVRPAARRVILARGLAGTRLNGFAYYGVTMDLSPTHTTDFVRYELKPLRRDRRLVFAK